MKALLISNSNNYLDSGYVNKLFPPLCLGYLASMLRELNIEPAIADLNLGKVDDKEISDADIILVSSDPIDRWQCPSVNDASLKKLLARILSLNKNAGIILIGPHATFQPKKYAALSPRIYVIEGEPEIKAIETIESIAAKRAGKEAEKDYSRHVSFSDLPRPAYDLFEISRYSYGLMPGKFFLCEASRGCPFRCAFCSKVMFPKRYAWRKITSIMDDLIEMERMHVKNVFFIDLDFCIDRRKSIELCKSIIASGIKIKWAIQTRVDKVDDELMSYLKKAGCTLIHFGVESYNQENIDRMKKGITISQVLHGFRIARKWKIKTLAYLVMDKALNPEEMDSMRKFIKRLAPSYLSIVPLQPYPDTEFSKNNRISGEASVPVNPKIESQIKKLMIEYYARPGYAINALSGGNLIYNARILSAGFRDYFIPLVMNNKKKVRK